MQFRNLQHGSPSSEGRQPMVMKGTRQVGKTWPMKESGQNYFNSFVYFNFNFVEEDELKSIFETNKNPQRIIELLIAGEKILARMHTAVSSGSWCGGQRQQCGDSGSGLR